MSILKNFTSLLSFCPFLYIHRLCIVRCILLQFCCSQFQRSFLFPYPFNHLCVCYNFQLCFRKLNAHITLPSCLGSPPCRPSYHTFKIENGRIQQIISDNEFCRRGLLHKAPALPFLVGAAIRSIRVNSDLLQGRCSIFVICFFSFSGNPLTEMFKWCYNVYTGGSYDKEIGFPWQQCSIDY
jgi:hypothetical protein